MNIEEYAAWTAKALRLLLIVILSIAAITLMAVAIERFLVTRRTPGAVTSWSNAIQLATTITLVVITGVYAYLTRRMVVYQEQSHRLAAGLEAARQVVERCSNNGRFVAGLMRTTFPISMMGPWPKHEYLKVVSDRLGEIADHLDPLSASLKNDLATLCETAVTKLTEASTDVVGLSVVLSLVPFDHHGAPTEANWNEMARRLRESREKARIPLMREVSLDAIVEGQPVVEALRAILSLEKAARSYLKSDS